MTRTRLAAVALALALPRAATAEEGAPSLRLGGRVLAHLRAPARDPGGGELQQASASVWLEAHPRLDATTAGHAVVTLDHVPASVAPAGDEVRAGVREAWLTVARGGVEARLGQQLTVWGNGDGVSPNDRLTALDYTFFSADDEVRRRGAPSAVVSYTRAGEASAASVSAAFVPVAPHTTFLLPPGLVPPGVEDLGLLRPRPTLGRAAYALRAGYEGDGWDASIVGYHGWNPLPFYALAGVDAGRVLVERRLQRLTSAGLYASASAGELVLRLDAAYLRVGDEPAAPPSRAEWVLGLERPFGERLRATTQLVGRAYVGPGPPGATADPIEQALARANALLHDAQDELRLASTASLTYTSEAGRLGAELAGAFNWVGHDYLVRATLTLRVAGALALRLGAEVFAGPRDRPLGALSDYSGLFADAQLLF